MTATLPLDSERNRFGSLNAFGPKGRANRCFPSLGNRWSASIESKRFGDHTEID